MRRLFVEELYRQMSRNDKVWLLTGDLGFNVLEPIKANFPERFINVGAAEQAMLDIAVGLALSGQVPFVYSITPFLLYRPYEAIRNYLHYEKIPVKLIGTGRDKEYGGLGLTHWAHDDKVVMGYFSNIKSYWPKKEELRKLVRKAVKDKSPYYINLSKL
jgi:transketolase